MLKLSKPNCWSSLGARGGDPFFELASLAPRNRRHADHLEPQHCRMGTLFADPVVATAIHDRLLHHGHVLTNPRR
jgi:hypothetical protein